MPDPNLEDTQPHRIKPAQPGQPKSKAVKPAATTSRKKLKIGRWGWALAFILLAGLVIVLGLAAGYQSGKNSWLTEATSQAKLTLDDQFKLGVEDLDAGRYEVARQRFEYILAQDPSFPGATDRLVQVMEILFATATPTPPLPTITPTPTADLRPVEELFNQAQQAIAGQDWTTALDTLTALRKSDPSYQTTRVDRLMYLALRQRGIDKILNKADLEGGIYDLSLAESFGPVDVEANNAREWARLYTYGLSFWEVHPEQAVYYFGQVASAMPYLRDSSGWTAIERYRVSLIQYGDLLASQKDWCNAKTQYELALAIRADPAVQETLNRVTLLCIGATETAPATLTETPTLSPPSTETIVTDTPTPTQADLATPTPTETLMPPTDTTEPPTVAPPTETPTPTPTLTEAPAQPSETPTNPSPLQPQAAPGAEARAWQLPSFSLFIQGLWQRLVEAWLTLQLKGGLAL